MRWGGGWVIAMVATACAVACEIVDPLDDIADGPRPDAGSTSSAGDGGASSGSVSTSSSSSSSASSSSSSSGSTPFVGCNRDDNTEEEPNDATAGYLLDGATCGELSSASDVDKLEFTSTGATISITVTAEVSFSYQLTHGAVTETLIANGPAQNIAVSIGSDVKLTLADPAITAPARWKIVLDEQ